MTSRVGAEWLLKASDEPAANLAAQIVKTRSLELPIPIEELVTEIATVSEEPWPYTGCDALVTDLASSKRPSVFLRSDLPERRKRFTLAHEFGHLSLAWHIGNLACNPDISEYNIEELQPAEDRKGFVARERLREQEAEATRFASFILIPDSFIRPLILSGDMDAILNELNKSNVSCQAALMRLHRLLLPGFAFKYFNGSEYKTMSSSGTARSEKLQANSFNTGRVQLAGREVTWYQLAEFEEFRPVDDTRVTTELLKSAIRDAEESEAIREKLRQSINGIAGGILSMDRAETPSQAYSILMQKFSSRDDLNLITRHPDFDLYLRRRAQERIERKK